MSDFKVYVDGDIFYHPNLSRLAILEAQIKEDAENIDSFTLSAPFNHPYLNLVKPMSSVIACKYGNEIIFEGRALDDGSDFHNTHTWVCEGALSYLKDSIQPPFEYKGTLKGLLEYFISIHNEKVEDKKKFTVGVVTVEDNNDYVSYSNSEFSVTLDAIKKKLIDTHGGYLKVRYTKNGKFLDYLNDFKTKSLQKVEYGKNLLDVEITRDHMQRVSALIPLGARKKIVDEEGVETESNERVDITGVNEGKNYIYDEDTVNEIGWIWASEVWENVTVPSNLLSKARTRLSNLIQGITSIKLTIVDESETGVNIGSIHAGMYVECVSKPHGIDGTYLCLSRTRDYLKPSGNTITIGASGVTLSNITVKNDKNLSALEDELFSKTEKLDSINDKLTEFDGTVQDVDALKEQVHNCFSEITKTSNQILSIVHDTYIDKTELESIQKDFQTSITQNSTEIRMDFTAVTDEIKNNVATNQQLLEEYIRFKGALIELGKIGNAFTAELSNEELAFKENGQKIAFISNNSLVITNAEIRNKLSLGNETRGWFDFIPRTSGNLSVVWRNPETR